MTVTVPAQRVLLAFDPSSRHIVVGGRVAGPELVRRCVRWVVFGAGPCQEWTTVPGIRPQ
jgi:hypothetical protein